MNEQNPHIEVAHSKEEMLDILTKMHGQGFHTSDIHIIAKDATPFEDIKWDTDVKTHEAGNWVDQFKSWFTGESAVKEGIKRFHLSEGQTAYYAQLVEHGAIVVFAERETDARVTIAIDQDENRYRHNPLEPRVTAPEPFIDTIDNAETPQQRENRLIAEEREEEAEQLNSDKN
ncbi:general stress protein [Lysinibacillus sp. 38-6]|uniref:general stress protein n=1 Tax=Lysinibacillus sp. 38-6 TaxID=3385991 RepID=UPI0039088B80